MVTLNGITNLDILLSILFLSSQAAIISGMATALECKQGIIKYFSINNCCIYLYSLWNDISSTGERTRTAIAPSHAMPITLPIELTGTTPKKVDGITLINLIITA
jgi:hypothetical protein